MYSLNARLPLLMLLLAAAVLLPLDAGAQDGQTGTVSATVFDAESGAYMPGVCLRLTGDGVDEVDCTLAEPISDIVFADIPFGSYTLTVDSAPDGCTTDQLPESFALDAQSPEHALGVGLTCAAGGGAGQIITIHKAECPSDFGNPFDECHDRVLGGIRFLIYLTTVETDEAGMASASVPAGNVAVAEDATSAAAYAGVYVYCSSQTDGTVLFDGATAVGAFTITVAPAARIICDVYNLTAPTGGGTGDTGIATPVSTGGESANGGTVLPSTGAAPAPTGAQDPLLVVALAVTLAAIAVALRRRAV